MASSLRSGSPRKPASARSSATPAPTASSALRSGPASSGKLIGGAGVVTGLALTRTGATAATVECLPLPGRGKIILTGNLVGSARDAAQLAVSLARARAKSLGLDPALFLHIDLHFHVMDPLPQKGGPSIGLPLYAALVSALTKAPVDPTWAFTGELSLTGAVLPVEGIVAKAKAVVRAGCTRLYLPSGNAEELKGSKLPKGLEVVSVDTVREFPVSA